jgi:hypothetical protein
MSPEQEAAAREAAARLGPLTAEQAAQVAALLALVAPKEERADD